MDQKIEAPNDDDVETIATRIVHARQLCSTITGEELDGSLDDLSRLQVMLDSGQFAADQTYDLQALGLAFGKVFVENSTGYDWWMVEDEYGRDPCVRYKHTSLTIFPQTMISKRLEDGEDVDVTDLFHGMREQLDEIIAENFTEH